MKTATIPNSAKEIVHTRAGIIAMNNLQKQRAGWSWWYLLFVVEFVVVLWPPFYNRVEPAWLGLPFFYWYQLLWVLLSAVITAVVYLATDTDA